MDKKYPKVGLGVMIQNEKGEVLLGLRQGFSHGTGEWCFPGGSLEFGETIIECARREAKEEVGLDLGEMELISLADEMRYIESHDKHYVNIGVKARYLGGEVKLMEPDKFVEWRWFALDSLPGSLFEGTELMLNNFRNNIIYKN
ncbi:MAG: NUDIX domain-containing protein [Planctomycetes bacterium]|jgi:mutator protein MutT|nr:NUDIX domain-containing protein [Planctomycetota bacterium]